MRLSNRPQVGKPRCASGAHSGFRVWLGSAAPDRATTGPQLPKRGPAISVSPSPPHQAEALTPRIDASAVLAEPPSIRPGAPMILRRLIFIFLLLPLFVAIPARAQCQLQISVAETAPGYFHYRASASGSCTQNGYHGGPVRLSNLIDCADSPCVFEFDAASPCQGGDFTVTASCWDANCGSGPTQTATVHYDESNNQPELSQTAGSLSAQANGDTTLHASLHVHDPGAWTDRVMAYQRLPGGIDAGTQRIGDLGDDVDVQFGGTAPPAAVRRHPMRRLAWPARSVSPPATCA